MRICFATHNKNKVLEIAQLAPDGVEIIGLDELGVTDDIKETGLTLEENSRIKATFIYSRFKIPVFGDDSGLEVDSLNGDPGVFSARYAGPARDDQQNIELLLHNLSGKPDRSARFKTVITYIDEAGSEKQFTGVVDGKIEDEQRGSGGFGYDPVFTPEDEQRTFAEMTAEEKNNLSHRARAFHQLLSYLQAK